MRWLRNVVFALLPMLVLFALAEGVLWALGLGAPAEQLSLSRGFDEQASYLAPDDGPPGSWRTQMNEGEMAEIHIPPKGRRTRVLLMGESNVELFPTRYLEDELNRAAPDPGFEVFNLGRRGYGSERIRILLKQALVTEPDVVVIYVGHNEFVEGEFKIQLRELHPSWLDELGTHLRTVNLLAELLRSLDRGPRGTGGKPEKRREHGNVFDDITPETTKLYLDAYRENLRSMCRMVLDSGARLVLSTVVTNVLVLPTADRTPAGMSEPDQSEFFRLRKDCLANLPLRLTDGLTPRSPGQPLIFLHFEDWGESWPPKPGWTGPPLPVLRPLSGELAGDPLWADPSRWEPVVWQLLATMQRFHERQLSAEEQASLERAVADARQALLLDPHHARMLFDLGIALYLLGNDDAEAVATLDKAAAEDLSPSHANDVINGIVRATARDFPEAAFVDAEQRFRDACPDRLAGYEVLMDNCHLHPGARKLLMRDFVPEIVRLTRN